MESDQRKIQISIFIIDLILIIAPILISQFTNINLLAFLPALLTLIIVVNLWAIKHFLLHDLEKRIPLARIRKLSRRGDIELYRFVDELTLDLVAKLDRLRDGELLLKGNEQYYEFVTRALSESKSNIYALDVNIDIEMLYNWNHRELREYYKQNINAINRGLEITRIFVFKKNNVVYEEGINPEVLSILEKQKNDGINVLVVWLEDVINIHPRISLNKDYLIFENDKVIYAPIPQGSQIYDEAIVTKAQDDLDKYMNLHNALFERAYTIEKISNEIVH